MKTAHGTTGPGQHLPTGDLRLTRRGRVVVTAVFLILVLGVFALVSGFSAATGAPGRPTPVRTVVVDQGDTLWQIAAASAGSGDIREMVHRIENLNALPGPGLVEGQRLAVPTS